ncbi:Serine/arginine repetitive matrix protein 2 [Pseudocyphellaria aurata]|nr:Serine/arginine repetitive matrix protein 2 [Pseudocyphellaria aurata]
MGLFQSRVESTSQTGSSRTPRPSRTSSPSRVRSRSPAIDGFRAGRDWSEPRRRSRRSRRRSRRRSSRAPRVSGSGVDSDQGEVHYPSRQSYGISSSRAPRVPESGLNYQQGGLQQSSRRSRRSSSRALRDPESQLNSDQGEVRYPSRQSYGISSSRAPRVLESGLNHHQGEARYSSRQPYGVSNGAHHVPGSMLNYEQGEAHYPSRQPFSTSSRAPGFHTDNQDEANYPSRQLYGTSPGFPLDNNEDEASYPSRHLYGTSIRAPGVPLDYQDVSHYSSRQSYGSSSRTPGVVDRQVHYQGESHHSSRQSYSLSSRAPRAGGSRPDQHLVQAHPRLRRTPHTPRSPRIWRRGTGYGPGYDGVEPSLVPAYDPARGIPTPFAPEGTLPTRQRSNFEGAPSPIRQFYDPEELEPRRTRGRTDPEYSFAFRVWFDPTFDVEGALESLGGSEDPSDEDEAILRHRGTSQVPHHDEPSDRHRIQRSAVVNNLGARFRNVDTATFREASGRVRSSMADNITARFELVDTATLEEGDQLCPICTNRYSVPTVITPSGSSDTENAVWTPCHHVIGRNCLRRWLEMRKTTCPICRANLLGR